MDKQLAQFVKFDVLPVIRASSSSKYGSELLGDRFFLFTPSRKHGIIAAIMRLSLLVVSAIFLTACAPSDPAPLQAEGPRGRMIQAAADRHDVPAELMFAIAHIEGGLFLEDQRSAHDDEAVPVAGVLELRHGRFDSLARGAELSGRSRQDLIVDLGLGTDAGAQVLADLARAERIDPHQLDAWANAVEELSGHLFTKEREEYRAEVFKLLRHGGTIRARNGEFIQLPAHPEIPLGLTFVTPGLSTLGNPEYQGAIWFETPQFAATTCNGTQAQKYDTDRGPYSVTMITIHDTEGGWNASVATLQNDPCKSVHYIVDKDGSRVGQFIPESYTGWHAGNYWYNQHSVGIEHVGYVAVDDYQTPMYEKSADLAKTIAARYSLPLDRTTFVAHQEVPDPNDIPNNSPPCPDSPGSCVKNLNYGGAGHHTDPGIYWEWCQYMQLVGGTCKCNDAFSLWNCVHDLSMMVRCPEGAVEMVQCADACVVEPIGVNDHCTPAIMSGSGGAGGASGAGGGGGAGGISDVGGSSVGAGVGGAGGAGGNANGGEGGAGGKTIPPLGEDSSCHCTMVQNDGVEGFGAIVAMGLLAGLRRRKRMRP